MSGRLRARAGALERAARADGPTLGDLLRAYDAEDKATTPNELAAARARSDYVMDHMETGPALADYLRECDAEDEAGCPPEEWRRAQAERDAGHARHLAGQGARVARGLSDEAAQEDARAAARAVAATAPSPFGPAFPEPGAPGENTRAGSPDGPAPLPRA